MATRTAKLYQGEDMAPVIDYTDQVIWEESEFGTRAWQGEGSASSVVIRDPLGEQGNAGDLPSGLTSRSLASKNLFIIELGSEYMFRGRVGIKNYSRDNQHVERYRQVEVSLHDTNWDLDHIFVNAYPRPAETDTARVQGLIASYLSANPRETTSLNGSNFLSGSNTVLLSAQTYSRTTPVAILREIGITANKQFFVTGDTLQGGSLFWDGNDSTVYQAGIRISDRLDEMNTVGSCSSASTTGTRYYVSGWAVGEEPGGEGSADAPAVTPDAAWTESATNVVENMLSLSDSANFDDGETSSIAQGATTGINCLYRQYLYPLSGSGTISGYVRGYAMCKTPTGIGVNEAIQDVQSQLVIRVVSSSGLTVRGTALPAHNPSSRDSTQWVKDTVTAAQRKFPASASWDDANLGAALTPVNYQNGDYLVVEWGSRNFTPAGQNSGGNIRFTNSAASDLPENETGTAHLNTWLELTLDNPATTVTFPPIWNVGPASTEDGSEQLCEVVLYYGTGSDQFVTVHSLTVHTQYGHASQTFTDNTAPDAATALVRATSILAHRRVEDKTYNVTIGPLTDDQVLCVKHGQTIQIKARAIPDADDQFRTMRIVQCRYTTPVPGTWFAHLQLGRPWKMEPYATGPDLKPKSGVASDTEPGIVGATGDPGTDDGEYAAGDHGHAHGYITSGGPYHMAEDVTIADAGGYFASGSVEGALQELGPGGGSTVTVKEVDGTPSVAADTIIFPNGTLTDGGSGDVTYTPAGGGSSFTGYVPSWVIPTPRVTSTNTDSTADRAVLTPVTLAGPMKVRGLLIEIVTSAAGSIQWGLYDASSSSTAATEEVSGSAAPGGTGWRLIAATGAPVEVPAGQYYLIVKLPSATVPTVQRFVVSSGMGLLKQQNSYTWDATPDVTAGWSDTANIWNVALRGDVDGSNQW